MTDRLLTSRSMFIELALAGLMLVATAAQGQLIRPGDESFSTGHLAPFEARYVQTMSGQPAGTHMERVHRLQSVRVAGQPAWRHSVLMLGEGMVEDEVTTQHEGGRPVLRRIAAPSLLHRVEVWDGSTIHGVTVAKEGTSAETYEIRADGDRFAGLQASVLAGLPLNDKREMFLAAINSDMGAAAASLVARVKVLSQEEVKTAAGTFQARKLHVDVFQPAAADSDELHGGALGLPTQVLWLVEQAPYLVKSEMQVPGGATMSLELASVITR